MFSNTAYEAMYEYLGLALHSKFIEVITSQKVFLGLITIIFGFIFFVTSVQFFSRYVPGALVRRRNIPLSKYVKIVFCLFIGIGFLRVGTSTSVRKFNGESWHDNPYLKARIKDITPQYKVSFLFDVISRSAEEIAALISRVVDKVFETSHSQLDAPNFFFKAVMYAGSSTLDDPKLKEAVKFYTEECFDRVLPFVKGASQENKLDSMFRDGSMDQKLAQIVLETENHAPYNCLDVKNEIKNGLQSYVNGNFGWLQRNVEKIMQGATYLGPGLNNLVASSLLTNRYLAEHEGMMGVQKGSQLPTTGGRIAQYLVRFFSWSGFAGAIGLKQYQGAMLAASRSEDFSENLARAPHVAGFIKMMAIAVFPWLLFFVVAGFWRVILYWYLIYFSVLLWTPIWTLLYHIMVNISLSSDVMKAFGTLGDGISLYSAELVTSRMYYLFSVYSWLQLLTGTLFSGMLLYFLRPALSDTQKDELPETINAGAKVAATAGKFVL